jgi:hypothetical protein
MTKDEPGLIRKGRYLLVFSLCPRSLRAGGMMQRRNDHVCLYSSNADGVESEVTLVHENDAAWFVTLDETHHEMTTAGKKGSASSGRWVNGSFPRSGERNVVGNFHTTGVYGTTLAEF